jgi:tetratricopeptide (TPR) repeat protein
MQKKQNNKTGKTSAATVPVGGAGGLRAEEAERVRELIAAQHSKSALQMAKDLHKRCATAESEALLVDVYQARIADLLKLRMTVEAKALMAIVSERFPAARPRLEELNRELCVLDGRLESVVGQLRDPNLAAADREGIETFIRQRVWDLASLADVSSLPREHSLRIAASALHAAFQAVTKGPVDDALLALPEVARRSPLAGWKALVRAIACYHRRRDEECGRWLLMIPDDAVPARLIPSLNAMLRAKADLSSFTAAEQGLMAAVADHGPALRKSLATLESALAAKKRHAILEAARTVVVASAGSDAALRERLRQHIFVRCLVEEEVPLTAISAALGGPPKHNAYFRRLMARFAEERHSVQSSAEAVLAWEEFRQLAIVERWFAAGSLEDGVLSLHMAQMAGKLPTDIVEEFEDMGPIFPQPRRRRDEKGLPSAAALYERACMADPSQEAFQQWLEWAGKHHSGKFADQVAERWHEARGTDVQPLLYLMDSAEKRDALKKSLNYLNKAEKLDRLNPAVRRAKLRIQLSGILRHLRQRKTSLAMAGIEHLQDVPEVRPGEITALSALLGWCCAEINKDRAAQEQRARDAVQLLGGVATHMVLFALIKEAELGPRVHLPDLNSDHQAAIELLNGTARACQLGELAGLPMPLHYGWTAALIDELKKPNCPADAAQLLSIGEAALRDGRKEIAYAVSVAGLSGGMANARFLFLRARALPAWVFPQWNGCFAAALELARRERDSELTGRILDELRGGARSRNEANSYRAEQMASRSVSRELLGEILEEEREATKFPDQRIPKLPRYAAKLNRTEIECDCPDCRARRGEPFDEYNDWEEVDEDEDDDEEDQDEDEDEDEDGDDWPEPINWDQQNDPDFRRPFPKTALNSAVKILEAFDPDLMRQAKEAIAAGENPIKILEKMMGKVLSGEGSVAAPGKSKRGRAADFPSPEQGSLF